MSTKTVAEKNWVHLYANFVDKTFAVVFSQWGRIVGYRPLLVIAGALVVTILCAMGFAEMEVESRGDKLWVPQNTRSNDDAKLYQSYFESSRVEFIIVEPKDGNNMLTKSNLMEFMKLYEQIGELTATVNGDVQTLNSLCIRDNSNGDPCLIISVLENWQYSLAVLGAEADDESVLDTLNARNSKDDLLDTLGNMKTDLSGRIISASAAKIVYILQDNKEVVDGDYVDERGDAWEQVFLDFLLEPKSTANFPNLKVFPVAQRSFSDEFGEAIQGDISLLIFSYIILLVYVGVNLGHMDSSCVEMRVMLALSVLVTVGMAIVSSTGLASSMGIMYTPLHSLLPFILLGIGVDDSFVIADAFDTVNAAASPRDKIAVALSHAGVSITITSITDLVAFAVSSVTSLPALSSFCVYAALGVTFLFLFQISFFSAVLTIDGMRQSSRRRDVCCCLVVPKTDEVEDHGKSPADGEKDNDKNGVEMSSRRHVAPLSTPPVAPAVASAVAPAVAPAVASATHQAVATIDHETDVSHTPPKQHAGALHAFLEHVYAVFLMTPMVKASVLVVFLGFVTYSIIGATRLSVESSERSFIPDDSYVLDALDRNDKYFGERGITVDIVTYDFDHFERQDILAEMQNKFDGYEKKSPYIEDPYGASFKSWYNDYLLWLNSSTTLGMTVQLDTNGRPTDRTEFYSSLHVFLNSYQGVKYNSSVVRSEDGSEILASKMTLQHTPFNTYSQGRLQVDADKAVSAMDDLRRICDNMEEPVIPWTFEYIGFESLKVIEFELYQGVGLSMAAVFIVVLLLIGSPLTSLIITFCVVSTLAGILGSMYFWDLVIDSVSVINIVLAIGLAVDYSAHVGHTFMLETGSRDERVIKALGSIGAAVLNGATSTILAVLLLAASQSYVFRVVFKQFFLTIIIGAAHGLVLLPVLLSLIGPPPFPRATKGHGEDVAAAVEIIPGHKQTSSDVNYTVVASDNSKSPGGNESGSENSGMEKPAGCGAPSNKVVVHPSIEDDAAV